MKTKLQYASRSTYSLEFIKNKRIISIIKDSYDKGLHDLANEWRMYSQPELFGRVVDEMYRMVGEKWGEYDYIAALGVNGVPLAYSLGLRYMKETFFLDDEWGVTAFFQQIKPSDVELVGKRVLILSPVFESGLKVCRGIDILREQTEDVKADVAVVVFFPDYVDENLVSSKRYGDVDFYYLFIWNDEVSRLILKDDN